MKFFAQTLILVFLRSLLTYLALGVIVDVPEGTFNLIETADGSFCSTGYSGSGLCVKVPTGRKLSQVWNVRQEGVVFMFGGIGEYGITNCENQFSCSSPAILFDLWQFFVHEIPDNNPWKHISFWRNSVDAHKIIDFNECLCGSNSLVLDSPKMFHMSGVFGSAPFILQSHTGQYYFLMFGGKLADSYVNQFAYFTFEDILLASPGRWVGIDDGNNGVKIPLGMKWSAFTLHEVEPGNERVFLFGGCNFEDAVPYCSNDVFFVDNLLSVGLYTADIIEMDPQPPPDMIWEYSWEFDGKFYIFGSKSVHAPEKFNDFWRFSEPKVGEFVWEPVITGETFPGKQSTFPSKGNSFRWENYLFIIGGGKMAMPPEFSSSLFYYDIADGIGEMDWKMGRLQYPGHSDVPELFESVSFQSPKTHDFIGMNGVGDPIHMAIFSHQYSDSGFSRKTFMLDITRVPVDFPGDDNDDDSEPPQDNDNDDGDSGKPAREKVARIVLIAGVAGGGGVIGIVALLCVCSIIVFCIWSKRQKKRSASTGSNSNNDKHVKLDEINIERGKKNRNDSDNGDPVPVSMRTKASRQKIHRMLVELELLQYEANFIQSGVMYDDLPHLDSNDLVDLIPEKIPRKRFQRKIAELASPDDVSSLDSGSVKSVPGTTRQKAQVQTSMGGGKGTNLKTTLDSIFIIDPGVLKIGKIIKSGSFGIVRKGSLTLGLGEIPVAVKTIPLEGEGSSMGDFEHEVRIMSEMRHENVLQCYGAYFENDQANIVLELCAKGDLYSYKKKKKMKKKQIMDFYVQIAKGMQYIHEKGLIHRDLKTQNILLTSDNVVKICDFGTTKHTTSVNQTFCGTVEYLAPEQYDTKLLSPDAPPSSIDVYSFAILMWELWTGKTPFSDLRAECNHNQFELLGRIHGEESNRPSLKDCDEMGMPELTKELMVDCWSKCPDERPHFDAIVEELENQLREI